MRRTAKEVKDKLDRGQRNVQATIVKEELPELQNEIQKLYVEDFRKAIRKALGKR